GCPSAAMTLHYGVERLLKQEFPDFEALVNV
ncbi:MAG: NifU family protein, partial [Candidatus Eisenbacteria bacterium]|nr:NifU family protein [Candidatus Latescibacterota bacterium]MBD3302401.1 NifU family protein [Candidatus Eisenbacteria bacterium]